MQKSGEKFFVKFPSTIIPQSGPNWFSESCWTRISFLKRCHHAWKQSWFAVIEGITSFTYAYMCMQKHSGCESWFFFHLLATIFEYLFFFTFSFASPTSKLSCVFCEVTASKRWNELKSTCVILQYLLQYILQFLSKEIFLRLHGRPCKINLIPETPERNQYVYDVCPQLTTAAWWYGGHGPVFPCSHKWDPHV